MNPTISKVNIVGDKCFVNFSGPSEPFKDINFIFGLNGHGKTTLANNIKRQAEKIGVNENEIKHFSANYIEEYSIIKESEELNGIEGAFGENVKDTGRIDEIKQKIDELNIEIHGTNEIEGLNQKIQKNCQTQAKKTLYEIHKNKKGDINLNFFPDKYFDESREDKGVYTYIIDELCQSRIKKAKGVGFTDKHIANATGEKDYDNEVESINSLFLNVELPELSILEDASRIIDHPYSDNNVPSKVVVDWIEQGQKLHNKLNDDRCKFCTNSVDYNDLEKRIEEYKEDDKTRDSKLLQKLLDNLHDITKKVEEAIANNTYNDYLDEEFINKYLKSSMGKLHELTKTITSTSKVIEQKIDNMHKSSFELTKMPQNIRDELNAITDINKELDKVKEHKESARDNQEILVKAAIATEIIKSSAVQQLRDEYGELLKELSGKQKERSLLEKEKNKLEQKLSDISGFIYSANSFISNLNLNFELVPTDDKKRCKIASKNGEGLRVDDISEGERNLLALLFFYHELIKDDGKSVDDDIKIIIIDDPLTSLDDNNQYYILELLKSICNYRNNSQFFVFTHSWNHFVDLSFKRNDDGNVSLYKIKKTDGISDVKPLEESPGTMYAELFRFLHRFAENDKPERDDYLHAPNAIRRVLEEYLTFNCNISGVSDQKEIDTITKVLINESDINKIDPADKLKVKTLTSVANILSHRISPSPSNDDIHDSAKFLMDRLKRINDFQYNKMVRNN